MPACGTITRLAVMMALLSAWILPASAQQLDARLLSRFLARGEQTILEITIQGARPPEAHPAIPEIKGISIRPRGSRGNLRQISGRQLEFFYEYTVSSYQTGAATIPPIEINLDGVPRKSEAIEFTVFNPDELQWTEAAIGSYSVRYAAVVRALKNDPYEGETVPVEVKLYLPEELAIQDWGLPDLERDGLTSWRFQPSNAISRVMLLGRPFVAMAYPSTITASRSGSIALGPGKLRLITQEIINDGFPRRVDAESNLTLPKLSLEARPLPEGAPDGFENAIGNFHIEVTTTLKEVQEGDPIPLKIRVSGTGNLDNLSAPKPVETDGWKVYDASQEQRGDERREHSGAVTFNQFLRPLEPKPAIPAFRLVFFDPKTSTYKSALTSPIPVTIKPSTAVPPAMSHAPEAGKVPVEQMTDILGLLPAGEITEPEKNRLPSWWWQIIPVALVVFLLVRIAFLRVAPRLARSPAAVARAAELSHLDRLRASADTPAFLMAAGRFAERWFGNHPPPEVAAIIAERDARCFRRDKPETESLDRSRKSAMVKTLKRFLPALPVLLAILILGVGSSPVHARETNTTSPAVVVPEQSDQQARAAYQAGRFQDAIRTWLNLAPYSQLSGDVLYHVGDACYRAGSPGHAALYFRRATLREPGHPEALQNLRFIERKYGSVVASRKPYQELLARVSLPAWKSFVWVGGWIAVISLLVFPATRRGAGVRLWAIGGLCIAPLIAATGALAWHDYPDESRFAAVGRQGVIVTEGATVHADASRTSALVTEAPAGSVCEIIRISGRWAYVSFATKTRGWIPAADVEKLIPTGNPEPPFIRKPKVDENSA